MVSKGTMGRSVVAIKRDFRKLTTNLPPRGRGVIAGGGGDR